MYNKLVNELEKEFSKGSDKGTDVRKNKSLNESKYSDFIKLLYGRAKVVGNPQETINFIRSTVDAQGIAGDVSADTYLVELDRAKEDPAAFQKVLTDWVVALQTASESVMLKEDGT